MKVKTTRGRPATPRAADRGTDPSLLPIWLGDPVDPVGSVAGTTERDRFPERNAPRRQDRPAPTRVTFVLALALATESCGTGTQQPSDAEADRGCSTTPLCYGADTACSPLALAATSGLTLLAGGIVALPAYRTPPDVIWPINSFRGTVFRVDSIRREIEAAYHTGPNHGDGCYGGQFAGDHPGGDSPSRAAVDDGGDLYVANRACGGQASVTKIAYAEERCIDRNGNGTIETSHGRAELLTFDSHDAWDDECILWHTVLGEPDSQARPLLLARMTPPDAEPRDVLWVGLYRDMQMVEMDPATGELTGEVVETPGLTPYNAAVTPDGWIWIVAFSTGVVGRFHVSDPINTYEPIIVDLGLPAQRVTVDERGIPWAANNSFVWLGNTDRLDFARLSGLDGGNILADGAGHVWTADGTCHMRRISIDDPSDVLDFDPGVAPHEDDSFDCGMAVDHHHGLWVFAGGSNKAAVINLDDLSVEPVLDDCDSYLCMQHPYIRGDITGFTRTINRRDRGSWTGHFQQCATARSAELVVNADVPDSSAVTVKVRGAAEETGLGDQPWVDLEPEAGLMRYPLGTAGADPWIEVRVDLLATRLDQSPVLRRVELRDQAGD